MNRYRLMAERSNSKRNAALPGKNIKTLWAGESNPELRDYYELLWYFGGSQTDMASLRAEDIDWTNQTISYARLKRALRRWFVSATLWRKYSKTVLRPVSCSLKSFNGRNRIAPRRLGEMNPAKGTVRLQRLSTQLQQFPFLRRVYTASADTARPDERAIVE